MENFATEFMIKLDGKLTPEQMKTVLMELEMFSANFDIEKKVTDIVPYQDCVPECYKVYLVSKKIEGMSPQSLRTYKCNLDDFFQTVNKPLNQITTNDIRVYLFGLSAKGNTNRTIDGKRLIIHTFLDWCVKEESSIRKAGGYFCLPGKISLFVLFGVDKNLISFLLQCIDWNGNYIFTVFNGNGGGSIHSLLHVFIFRHGNGYGIFCHTSIDRCCISDLCNFTGKFFIFNGIKSNFGFLSDFH